MTRPPTAEEISLQTRNIVVLAHALGSDVATVARALDTSGLMLVRTGLTVAHDVLSVLQPHQENGNGKRKHRS